MAYLGGLHFWWPKMTGRMYPEGWAKLSALMIFLGFNLTFFPQFILGYLGMPRRYHVYPDEFQVLHVLSTAGASVLAVGYLLPLIYFAWSLRYGRVAGANPWGATGLEWTDRLAAADPQFRRDPGGDSRSLRLQHGRRGGDRSWLATTLTWKRSRCTSSSIPPTSRRTPRRWGCGSFSSPKSCSSAACSPAYTVYRAAVSGRLRAGQQHAERDHRRGQHRRPAVQQLHHGAGRARGATGERKH